MARIEQDTKHSFAGPTQAPIDMIVPVHDAQHWQPHVTHASISQVGDVYPEERQPRMEESHQL